MVDKELIENWRNMVKLPISSLLFKTNYEGMGEQDKEEFERDFDEILDLALIGLKHKEQLSQEGTTKDTTSDLISRQAAIELAMKYCPDDDGTVQCDGDIRELLDELENLPSVQPEIIRCGECVHSNKEYSGEMWYRMSDAIEIDITPHNDTFTKFVDDLLAYEERNDVFNLTTKERAEFQSYVRERMEL